MEATLKKEIFTVTYNDTEKLIYDCIWKFIRRYGGDFDELKAEANLIYILAFQSYQEQKAYFSTWLQHCIRTGLLDYKKRQYKQQLYSISFEDKEYCEPTIKKPSFRISEILEEISADSRTIIKIIFEPPEGITNKDLEKGFNACNTRIYIKDYLSAKLGWTGRRIKESFEEIRNAISN